MKRALRFLALSVVLVSLVSGAVPAQASLDRTITRNVMSAVVQVSLVRLQGGQVYYLPWGSGTIISSDGLILTNCHVADPVRYGLSADEVPDYDYLGIGLTVKSDSPPKLSYLAEVVQADPVLDLAVIRVTRTTDGSSVKAEDLDLPYLELGDSDEIEVGDDLNIFGYPGIGGETVTFTRGVVSGFTLDASIEGRAWIKTDASISGGNSGGTCVDNEGLLIGVPTRAGVGGGTEPVDCRPVKDTNGDGQIDDKDDCVPIGGFINALRPVNLAKPLVEAARRGLPDPRRNEGTPGGQPAQTTAEARLSNVVFSTGVSDFDQPTQLVSALPSGSRSLYLFFDYEGMSESRTFEMKVLVNGSEQSDWAFPAAPWSGDEQGTWWLGWGDAQFADGTYRFVLYVDGEEATRAQITVGGRTQTGPTLSNLTLSLEADAQGKPVEPAVVFPVGAQQILASFHYENMQSSLRWAYAWETKGQEIGRKEGTWQWGRSGNGYVTLTSTRGFSAGAYRLELYVSNQLAAFSDFWVTGDTTGGGAFGPITFAAGADRNGDPVGTASRFASGLKQLHAFSDYSGMDNLLHFEVDWYVDGEKVIEAPQQWGGGASGTWHDYLYIDGGTLPDGTYALELLVEGQTIREASTTVGSGAQPTPTPGVSRTEGVALQGHVVDLDTKRAIQGAVFLVLNPGITLDTFSFDMSEVYTLAETDRTGYFELPDLLARGECYSMIVAADGYWASAEDDVCITRDLDSPLELTISLEKK